MPDRIFVLSGIKGVTLKTWWLLRQTLITVLYTVDSYMYIHSDYMKNSLYALVPESYAKFIFIQTVFEDVL